MDTKHFRTKEDFFDYFSKNPEMVSFEGWERGGPKLTDDGQKQTWESAQSMPWYDEDVERFLIQLGSKLGKSAYTEAYPSRLNFQSELKHLPEIKAAPGGDDYFMGGNGMLTPFMARGDLHKEPIDPQRSLAMQFREYLARGLAGKNKQENRK